MGRSLLSALRLSRFILARKPSSKAAAATLAQDNQVATQVAAHGSLTCAAAASDTQQASQQLESHPGFATLAEALARAVKAAEREAASAAARAPDVGTASARTARRLRGMEQGQASPRTPRPPASAGTPGGARGRASPLPRVATLALKPSCSSPRSPVGSGARRALPAATVHASARPPPRLAAAPAAAAAPSAAAQRVPLQTRGSSEGGIMPGCDDECATGEARSPPKCPPSAAPPPTQGKVHRVLPAPAGMRSPRGHQPRSTAAQPVATPRSAGSPHVAPGAARRQLLYGEQPGSGSGSGGGSAPDAPPLLRHGSAPAAAMQVPWGPGRPRASNRSPLERASDRAAGAWGACSAGAARTDAAAAACPVLACGGAPVPVLAVTSHFEVPPDTARLHVPPAAACTGGSALQCILAGLAAGPTAGPEPSAAHSLEPAGMRPQSLLLASVVALIRLSLSVEACDRCTCHGGGRQHWQHR